ncbi:MAG: hypothetical protein H7Y59_01795 [Anaerolineales bacterium]|nr:hypothetical protein [Anaerolineales bacterium]
MYPFIFVFPGYVTGYTLNLFNFRKRTPIVQIIMAMPISASIAPAILFLVYRFASFSVVFSILVLLAVLSIYVFVRFYRQSMHDKNYQRLAIIFAVLWVILSIITLADLQIGNRLYFSSNSYDLTTRVSVTDAITRTGVPPVNPSYYPGQTILLNSLYYYWYILASIVDQMGGNLVSAYHAMIASISWAGLLLFATLATYLRVRDDQESQSAWKKSFIGIQLFVIGGLDFIMVLIIMSSFHFRLGQLPFQGQLEGWNMPIMSWMNALAWVPHHLVAALACILSLLIAVQNMDKKFTYRIPHAIIIGLAFASAFGLSVWVMFVFAIFWIIWGMVLIFKEKKYQQILFMILGGVFGLIFVFPFLLGILRDGGASSSPNGGLPLAFYIRPFMITSLLTGFSHFALSILDFAFLPLNYLFELGFFFLMAIIWLQEIYQGEGRSISIYKAELILVVVTIVVLSFLYSNIIVINDLGIRGWLPLQFILVVWSADVLFQFGSVKKWLSPRMFDRVKGTKTLRLVLSATMIIGILTMSLEFLSLRAWSILVDMNVVGFPNNLSPDTRLGNRTYSARLAYNYLRDHFSHDVITQNNPLDFLDRPSGLYGNHQMIISNRTSYGVSPEIYDDLVDNIGVVFTKEASDWGTIDSVCMKYSIDILILKDTDPLWDSLETLKVQRPPIYENEYYALYTCGGYIISN